jgi:hypothetical protein
LICRSGVTTTSCCFRITSIKLMAVFGPYSLFLGYYFGCKHPWEGVTL